MSIFNKNALFMSLAMFCAIDAYADSLPTHTAALQPDGRYLCSLRGLNAKVEPTDKKDQHIHHFYISKDLKYVEVYYQPMAPSTTIGAPVIIPMTKSNDYTLWYGTSSFAKTDQYMVDVAISRMITDPNARGVDGTYGNYGVSTTFKCKETITEMKNVDNGFGVSTIGRSLEKLKLFSCAQSCDLNGKNDKLRFNIGLGETTERAKAAALANLKQTENCNQTLPYGQCEALSVNSDEWTCQANCLIPGSDNLDHRMHSAIGRSQGESMYNAKVQIESKYQCSARVTSCGKK